MRSSHRVLLCAVVFSVLTGPVTAAENARYIVTFAPNIKRSSCDEALCALDVKASRYMLEADDAAADFSMALVEVPAGGDLQAQLARAMNSVPASRRIVSVEKDARLKWFTSASMALQSAPVPAFDRLVQRLKMAVPSSADAGEGDDARFKAEVPWGVRRVNAPTAWPRTRGSGVRVAVLDSGIDWSHSDLRSKIAGGYSAILKSAKPEDYRDDNGHGTHVAGTIAAARDGAGVVGVAPDARLYAIKALDADGSGRVSDVIDGLMWAVKNKMDVVNMSVGIPVRVAALERAIQYAKKSGLTIIAAAGNTGAGVDFPGAYDETVAVSACDRSDHLADFSSRGAAVDFIAPGVDVPSSWMGGGVRYLDGTSMATPHVSGLAALVLAQSGPIGPDALRRALTQAARLLPGLTPAMQGAGLIDAGRMFPATPTLALGR